MVLLPSSMIVMTDRHFCIGLKYTFPYPTFERKSFADDMEHVPSTSPDAVAAELYHLFLLFRRVNNALRSS